jgi:putative endonuclease
MSAGTMRRRARNGTSAATTALGREAEARARRFIQEAGFKIVASNFRSPAGEIDIIAREGEVLCFVEVRSRAPTSTTHPLETITYEKRRRIERAAEVYLERMEGPRPPVRFDVVSVTGQRIELVRDAFQTG